MNTPLLALPLTLLLLDRPACRQVLGGEV